MEKILREACDKLPEDKKGPIEAGLADAKKALESEDPDQIKKALEDLNKLGADLYQAAAAGGGMPNMEDMAAGAAAAGGAGAPPPPPGDGDTSSSSEPKPADVVDADFEVVEDDENKDK